MMISIGNRYLYKLRRDLERISSQLEQLENNLDSGDVNSDVGAAARKLRVYVEQNANQLDELFAGNGADFPEVTKIRGELWKVLQRLRFLITPEYVCLVKDGGEANVHQQIGWEPLSSAVSEFLETQVQVKETIAQVRNPVNAIRAERPTQIDVVGSTIITVTVLLDIAWGLAIKRKSRKVHNR